MKRIRVDDTTGRFIQYVGCPVKGGEFAHSVTMDLNVLFASSGIGLMATLIDADE